MEYFISNLLNLEYPIIKTVLINPGSISLITDESNSLAILSLYIQKHFFLFSSSDSTFNSTFIGSFFG